MTGREVFRGGGDRVEQGVRDARAIDPTHFGDASNAAPKAPRTSVTTGSAGPSIRISRQARCPASAPAAGIDAASMAAPMPKPLLKMRDSFPGECCLPASHARHGEDGDSSQRS